ncbi:MAG TPA: response regulator transcription factor [Chloroflexota bacterium]|nr:response regulator transcription factor [Chloroflexota bacterium]
MSEPIRVVIADDHAVVREGLRLILEASPGFAVVGEAADGAVAVHLVEEAEPDVVLMDLRMPGMDGLQAIEQIREHRPRVAVVILTTYNEDDLVLRGLQAGARGYLLKDMGSETLVQTIRAAARGEILLQPQIMARVLARTTARPADSNAGTPHAPGTGELTERELEVLAGVARGERSKEVAVRLGVTESTVKAHLASIYAKLDVDSRASAVAVAMARGLLPSGDRL